jgi:hypothetical protein
MGPPGAIGTDSSGSLAKLAGRPLWQGAPSRRPEGLAGIDQVLAYAQFDVIFQEATMRSIELPGTQVISELASELWGHGASR